MTIFQFKKLKSFLLLSLLAILTLISLTDRVIAWTDNTLTPGTTPIRAVHIQELRDAINARRQQCGLAPFTWADPILTPGVTRVRKYHINQLRRAVRRIYAVPPSRPLPNFSDTIDTGVLIRATHINELRNAYDGATCCGDGECNGFESPTNCPQDCTVPPCGNNSCDTIIGENCVNCRVDCGPCRGCNNNGQCGSGENCATCPGDCVCPATCGNGQIDADEICDDGVRNGILCSAVGNGASCNYCNATCGEIITVQNGDWGQWQGGGDSCVCDGGVPILEEERFCDSPPPSNGGAYCTGADTRTQPARERCPPCET